MIAQGKAHLTTASSRSRGPGWARLVVGRWSWACSVGGGIALRQPVEIECQRLAGLHLPQGAVPLPVASAAAPHCPAVVYRVRGPRQQAPLEVRPPPSVSLAAVLRRRARARPIGVAILHAIARELPNHRRAGSWGKTPISVYARSDVPDGPSQRTGRGRSLINACKSRLGTWLRLRQEHDFPRTFSGYLEAGQSGSRALLVASTMAGVAS